MKQLFGYFKPKLTWEVHAELACVMVMAGFSAFALQQWFGQFLTEKLSIG